MRVVLHMRLSQKEIGDTSYPNRNSRLQGEARTPATVRDRGYCSTYTKFCGVPHVMRLSHRTPTAAGVGEARRGRLLRFRTEVLQLWHQTKVCGALFFFFIAHPTPTTDLGGKSNINHCCKLNKADKKTLVWAIIPSPDKKERKLRVA